LRLKQSGRPAWSSWGVSQLVYTELRARKISSAHWGWNPDELGVDLPASAICPDATRGCGQQAIIERQTVAGSLDSHRLGEGNRRPRRWLSPWNGIAPSPSAAPPPEGANELSLERLMGQLSNLKRGTKRGGPWRDPRRKRKRPRKSVDIVRD
jgi:hypothetical protein